MSGQPDTTHDVYSSVVDAAQTSKNALKRSQTESIEHRVGSQKLPQYAQADLAVPHRTTHLVQ